MNRLDDFLNNLDDGWRLEDVVDEPATTKRSGLPPITWVRQYLRKHGATPAHVVLAAGLRAGYRRDLVEGTFERNRQWFQSSSDLWFLKPTAPEWLADYLIENGETRVADVLKAGEEAGFRPGTVTTAKGDVGLGLSAAGRLA